MAQFARPDAALPRAVGHLPRLGHEGVCPPTEELVVCRALTPQAAAPCPPPRQYELVESPAGELQMDGPIAPPPAAAAAPLSSSARSSTM